MRRPESGQSAIGKHIVTSYSGSPVSRTIVGVVAEARLTSVIGGACGENESGVSVILGVEESWRAVPSAALKHRFVAIGARECYTC